MDKRKLPIIAACCFLFFALNVGATSTAFGVFQPFIVAREGMGDGLASLIASARTLTSFFISFAAARYYERLDCRLGISLACAFAALAFLVFGLAHTLWQHLLAAVLCGIAYGLGGTVAVTLLVERCFADKRGLIVSVASLGSGFTSIVLPPLCTWVVHRAGLDVSFYVLAGIAAALALLMYCLLRLVPPAGEGKEEGESCKDEQASGAVPGSAVADVSRGTRYLLRASVGLIGFAAFGMSNFFALFMSSSGFSEAVIAFVLSFSGACMAVSKLSLGWIFDAKGGRFASLLFIGAFIAGLCILCFTPLGNMPLLLLGALLAYGGSAIVTIGLSMWSMEFAGAEGSLRSIKNNQAAFVLGAAVGGFVPGILMELMGSYVYSFALFVVAAIFAFVFVRRIYRWAAEITEAAA